MIQAIIRSAAPSPSQGFASTPTFDDSNHSKETQNNVRLAAFTYLGVRLVVGALLGILLASQSGDETREWIATKWRSGVDTVNAKARQTHQRVKG